MDQQILPAAIAMLRSIFCLSISQECVKQRILNTHKKQHTFCLSIYQKWIYFFVAANSTFFQPFNWPLQWPFWSNFFTEGVVFLEESGNAKKPKPKSVRVMSLQELLL